MATLVDSEEAPAQLSGLLQRAAAGEEIIITHEGKPAVRLVPIEPPARKRPRVPGTGKGKFRVSSDFDAPLSEEDLREWYERGLTTDTE